MWHREDQTLFFLALGTGGFAAVRVTVAVPGRTRIP
jgi:hypothetical protein